MSVFIGYPSFMAYQMMKGKKDNNDGFPSIPGMIARYSALGLTNEQMAANPVWADKTGNDHDLQMKNFTWGGMSGVGGYVVNFKTWSKAVNRGEFTITDSKIHITKSNIARFPVVYTQQNNNKFQIKVTGVNSQHVIMVDGTNLLISEDGYYTIDKMGYIGFGTTKILDSCDITIEQLPLYPGALVFDGVADCGVCENFPILTKEKGYTVVALRQWIEEKNNSTALVSNCKNWNRDGAFLFEYNNLKINFLNVAISFGHVFSVDRGKSPFSYQTSKLYNGKNIKPGSFIGSNELVVGKGNKDFPTASNAAIWELVLLDHDATEEELTKIKDYFVKTYPWLFFDQAWTVTGKTNEDEDRATIANITGNGNNLVLSNFGFAEGSGYNEEGEYAGYLVIDGVDDKVQSYRFTMNEDWTIVGDWELLSNVQINCGIVKAQNVYLYNVANGLLISINNPRSLQRFGTKSLHVICSDGRLYDRNWVEYEYTVDQNFAIVESSLNIGFNLNNYTQIAFKNLGIYNNQILSKDDCIKAYNYLQTLKAK